jgi:hypothetical protein
MFFFWEREFLGCILFLPYAMWGLTWKLEKESLISDGKIRTPSLNLNKLMVRTWLKYLFYSLMNPKYGTSLAVALQVLICWIVHFLYVYCDITLFIELVVYNYLLYANIVHNMSKCQNILWNCLHIIHIRMNICHVLQRLPYIWIYY